MSDPEPLEVDGRRIPFGEPLLNSAAACRRVARSREEAAVWYVGDRPGLPPFALVVDGTARPLCFGFPWIRHVVHAVENLREVRVAGYVPVAVAEPRQVTRNLMDDG